MFLAQLLFALTADTLAVDLDAWVPRRMGEAHAVAIGVAVVSAGAWEWHYGVENVLSRTPVGENTAWPVRIFSSSAVSVAVPHSALGLALQPGLISLGVWSALAWILLIPLSGLIRHEWRFGRWHEVLAILLAVPVTWIFLRRIAGPVMATYLAAIAAAQILIPFGLAALAWRKSRFTAMAILVLAAAATWTGRHLPIPLPSNLDGGPPEGATLSDLRNAMARALPADSLDRAGMGFDLENGRWIAHDRSRGAEALLVLLPAREMGVIVVSNTGETTGLLEEIVDSIAR